MAEVKHYDLGDALLRVEERGTVTLVQLGNPAGVVRLGLAETGRLIEAMLAAKLLVKFAPDEPDEASAIILDLRERLSQANADNDLAQAEIARLTADKPKRARTKKEADAPPAEWEGVPAEPVTDQGAQEDHLPGFAVGDQVETVSTGELGVVERLFADNPRKVQAAINGRPHVFDVTMLRLVAPLPSLPIPEGLELDVPELVETLEAVGLTVLTEVPEVVVTDREPGKLRMALYEDSKLYGYTPEDMKALIAEVVGEPKSSRELEVWQLSEVLQVMHERGRQSRMPF